MRFRSTTHIAATAAAWFLIASAAAAIAQPIVLESTPLGTVGKLGGTSVTAVHFSGWRFAIDSPLEVERVGGHLLTNIYQEGDVFAALVALDSIDSFPHGSPFTSEEIVATTKFRPHFPSDEVSVPLSATLMPGSYALVFGSGLFGATGEAALPLLDDQPDIPPTTISSYIFWSIPFLGEPPIWRTNLASRMRFVVEGEVPYLAGDYDRNGSVDTADYPIWLADFDAAGNRNADGNNNGVVDAADYTTWRDHLGNGSSPDAGPATVVPEPMLAALLAPVLAWAFAAARIPLHRLSTTDERFRPRELWPRVGPARLWRAAAIARCRHA